MALHLVKASTYKDTFDDHGNKSNGNQNYSKQKHNTHTSNPKTISRTKGTFAG